MNTIEKREKAKLFFAELKILQQEIAQEESMCNHQWGAVQYDPEPYKEAYGYHLVAQGSDCWSEPEGYRDASRPRWSRTCSCCGKKEFTNKQKVEKTVPDFGK